MFARCTRVVVLSSAVTVGGVCTIQATTKSVETKVQCVDVSNLAEANLFLANDGAVIIKNADTSQTVDVMSKLLTTARKVDRIDNVKFVQSSAGRYHMSMINNNLATTARSCQENSFWLNLFSKDPARSVDTSKLTMAQLLDSRPGSASQIWHCDNYKGGVTVVVALCDVTKENGPTALHIGSHLKQTRTDFLTGWLRPARIAKPTLCKGDVLLYSSKLIHRGEPNQSAEARPILVYRYDNPDTPPPGIGAVGSQMIALYGWLASR
eukprot:m.101195 g.101195  ORF g.101195 m.101195 type:complete len:266 (+) comp27313_c0_seq1:50-847(+)